MGKAFFTQGASVLLFEWWYKPLCSWLGAEPWSPTEYGAGLVVIGALVILATILLSEVWRGLRETFSKRYP